MILEGILSTIDEQGDPHLAPQGPIVDATMRRFTLRPFKSSTTWRHLARTGEGVFHVTDDVLLLAQTAVGRAEPTPRFVATEVVRGWRLEDACLWYGFRVVDCDDSSERASLTAEVVEQGRIRDFLGFNRARHAVVEAAILATRVGILPWEQIVDDMRRLAPLVQKTGGEREVAAFEFLQKHLRARRPADETATL